MTQLYFLYLSAATSTLLSDGMQNVNILLICSVYYLYKWKNHQLWGGGWVVWWYDWWNCLEKWKSNECDAKFFTAWYGIILYKLDTFMKNFNPRIIHLHLGDTFFIPNKTFLVMGGIRAWNLNSVVFQLGSRTCYQTNTIIIYIQNRLDQFCVEPEFCLIVALFRWNNYFLWQYGPVAARILRS